LQEFGHEVIVANVQELRAITHNDRTSDRVDAEKNGPLCAPGSEGIAADLTPQRRHAGVAHCGASPGCAGPGTNAMVNAVRGLSEPCVCRLPASSNRCFPRRVQAAVPEGLRPALGPLLEQLEQINQQIKAYDRLILEMTLVN